MTVRDGDAQALRCEGGLGGRDDLIAHDLAPDLEWLALGFLLLAADIGDDVVDDLRAVFERLARARNRLIRTDQHALNAKFRQREQRRHIALQGAVGLDGDKAALRAKALAH